MKSRIFPPAQRLCERSEKGRALWYCTTTGQIMPYRAGEKKDPPKQIPGDSPSVTEFLLILLCIYAVSCHINPL
ncbi:hypothetical protein CC80DRAFT_217902 [Byssothecium circinans]|uniref:Uncharacterized protein n=1 Tax=Byssothecium circinans TaxID=147558 RepID=A0A6A5TEB2_9PLEO|nr:hypothetical protein CC80DRAFT_217902 [Byssothecium circinans]